MTRQRHTCTLCARRLRTCLVAPTSRPSRIAWLCAKCLRTVAFWLHADAPLCRPTAEFIHGL